MRSTVQKEDFPFRFNIQVAIILAMVLVALALPLILILIAFRPAPKPEPAADEALRQALIQVSESTLAPQGLQTETVAITRTVPDLDREQGAIEAAARECGGVALAMEETKDSRRLMAQIPSARATEFLSKIEKAAHNAIPEGALQGGSAVFEITLRISSP